MGETVEVTDLMRKLAEEASKNERLAGKTELEWFRRHCQSEAAKQYERLGRLVAGVEEA